MSQASILVVEDERVVSRDIQLQLQNIGYRVAGAAVTGEDAIRLALETSPDLVLMDIRLEGEMDGIQAADSIRRQARIPVVYLTAYADDETVRRAGQSEPFGYLLKPFEETQLKAAIEMALYKHAAEKKLRESERRYATTLSSIGDAVIATDELGKITFMNPVAEALTKWSLAEATGRPVVEIFRIINEDTRLTVEDPVAKVLRLGTIVGLANHTLLIAKDGTEIHIDDSGAPIIDDNGDISGVVLVFRDIGHQKEMDDALRQAQANLALVGRLSRLGELAASIAHEVNQPLTAIVSNAETCLRYLEQAKAAADRMAQNSHRAGDVVRSIRGLASKSPDKFVEIDLNEVVQEVVSLLRGEIRRHNAEVETRLVPSIPRVYGDRVQLQQLILNLLMNAMEAMTSAETATRRITISSKNLSEAEVEVSVSDTGPGLNDLDNERIFDAMFTTKREGMGLGLAICRSIVEAHGGKISAGSETDTAGAKFAFSIPAVNDAKI
ncbi:ATP-binding protein [Agrobacterium tumefaciens]|uniref:ATP-binding response regulator n=1 Tax=Agrobacterium tumefaciens TaxID=358 RepID=UPI00287C6C04|nr:ATP-binding protein [Agrobacterium tumefaciens]MDS7595411.1 response regulator [Agrobacterium tumefaciens]